MAGLLITTEAMIAEAPKKDPRFRCRAAAAAWAAWISDPSHPNRQRRAASGPPFCFSGCVRIASRHDRTIDYYFTLPSPWTYLGHALFVAICARHGVAIRYKPMPIGEVFDATVAACPCRSGRRRGSAIVLSRCSAGATSAACRSS